MESTLPMNRWWSPAENVSTVVHSRVAIEPSMSGKPVGPRCQAAPQNSSRPGLTGAWAKQSDRSCWSVPSTLTAYLPARRTMGVMNRLRSSATMTRAGSTDTDEKALTVIPAGCSPSKVVTTLIPVAKWPMTCRKSSGRGSILASLRGGRARPPRPAEACQARPHDALDALQLRTQGVGPFGGEAIRPSPILRGQRFDEPVVLQSGQRGVERPRTERLACQLAGGDHDRVAGRRPLAERGAVRP